MHELLRARGGQVPEARIHDRDGYGTCAVGARGAVGSTYVQGLRSSAETNDLGWPDWSPDDGLKLAGPDGLQIVLQIRGAGALDVEAPDRAAPARVPPAVNDRAMNLDGPRGGCQAGLVQLQALVSGIADDQGDRDHALGHGIAPSWCAAARRLLRRPGPEHESAVVPARDVCSPLVLPACQNSGIPRCRAEAVNTLRGLPNDHHRGKVARWRCRAVMHGNAGWVMRSSGRDGRVGRRRGLLLAARGR